MTAEKCPKCGTFMTTVESPYEYETNINIKYCKKCSYEERVRVKPKENNTKSLPIWMVDESKEFEKTPQKYQCKTFTELMKQQHNKKEQTFESAAIKNRMNLLNSYINNFILTTNYEEKFALLVSRKMMCDTKLMINRMNEERVWERIDGKTALELMNINLKLYKIFHDHIISVKQTPGQILKKRIEKPDGGIDE